MLAVSGGPDSTALMLLAARWRAARKTRPKLIAVTVDHGLRTEAKREAAAVAQARAQAQASRTASCAGPARSRRPACSRRRAQARYRLLARGGAASRRRAHPHRAYARRPGRDGLIRMSRGSGHRRACRDARGCRPAGRRPASDLVRPLLDIPKARLVATLKAAKIALSPTIPPTATRASPARACAS